MYSKKISFIEHDFIGIHCETKSESFRDDGMASIRAIIELNQKHRQTYMPPSILATLFKSVFHKFFRNFSFSNIKRNF